METVLMGVFTEILFDFESKKFMVTILNKYSNGEIRLIERVFFDTKQEAYQFCSDVMSEVKRDLPVTR